MQKVSNNISTQQPEYPNYIDHLRANHESKMAKNKLLTMVAKGREKMAETIKDHYKSGKGKLNQMTVIRSITGSGKSYAITNHLIPELMKDETEIIFLVSPDTSAYDARKIKTLSHKYDYEFFDSGNVVNKVEELLQDCETNNKRPRAIIFMHNCNVYNGVLVDMLLDHTTNIAFIEDECHLTLTSGYGNYLWNNGNKPPAFAAAMYKAVCKISAVSPLVYGLTATPTPEMDVDYPNGQHIKPVGSMDFDIMDIEFTELDRLWYIAYMANETRFDGEDPQACRDILDKALDHHFSSMNRLSNTDSDSNLDALPMSMLIFAAREKSNFGMTKVEIIKHITEYCRTNEILAPGTETLPFARIDGKGTFMYQLRANRKKAIEIKYGKTTNDKVKTRRDLFSDLDNVNHPISILIVVEVGNVGININSSKTILDYRAKDCKGINNYGLYAKPTQKAGRGSRKNYSVGQAARIDYEFGGNLNEFYKSLTKVELRRHIEANTIKIFCPNTSAWDEALIQIAERAMLPVEVARAMIKSICGR